MFSMVCVGFWVSRSFQDCLGVKSGGDHIIRQSRSDLGAKMCSYTSARNRMCQRGGFLFPLSISFSGSRGNLREDPKFSQQSHFLHQTG
ncbi:hypothetical protein EUGRSUZ_F02542 [Eucalyptus grandis]|uniref:Uncharacterized protein n=2 Tax=Eucalyptus grandis TaxID=71139 RepID=A0A059BTN5_EUCGR|nr:hypothetical protein EUGRSUZ_F02542 [Eucalyptus grandis]